MPLQLCHDPLPLSEACLQSLCASLNAPVIHIEQLPVEPARAAIVIYAEEYGDFGLAVGMRSLESGQTALYRYRASIPEASEIPAAMEDALSFAEGLGFLFDEDMIAQHPVSGRQQALAHWERLVGEGEVWTHAAVVEPPAPELTPELASADDELFPPMEELLEPIDEFFPLESDDLACEMPLTGEIGDTPPAIADVPSNEVSLTKFRRPAVEPCSPPVESTPAAAVGAEGFAGAASALGRVPIVKMRKDGENAKAGFLTRLLAGF